MQKALSHQNISRTGKWSAFLTIACAIHCILMPFVSTLLPVIGLQFLESELFEVGLVGLGLSFGAYSIIKSYFKVHHNHFIFGLFIFGTLFLLGGILFLEEPAEIWAVVAGALMVGTAQFINIRKTHDETCEHDH